LFFLLFCTRRAHGGSDFRAPALSAAAPLSLMTWATRITIFRIVLIPVFIGLMVTYGDTVTGGHPVEAWRYAAIGVFVIASLSDALDGYLARNWNQRSALGALLDPVADKLLLLAVLITFGIIPPRYFPVWFTVIILSRDALLLLGYFVVKHFLHQVEVRPHWSGKLSTFFTFLAIAAVLFQAQRLVWWLCLLGAFFAVICTVIYVRQGLAMLSRGGHTSATAS
jgi:CDP-diacylglycerol--glycerol-3-phosphate 3-phosphatidyltransferase/cardiolipin synthase